MTESFDEPVKHIAVCSLLGSYEGQTGEPDGAGQKGHERGKGGNGGKEGREG